MHLLMGFVNGSTPMPPPLVLDHMGHTQSNPLYSTWKRYDQCIRFWLFATLSREVLIEVHTLLHSSQVWDKLKTHFVGAGFNRALDLKRTLNDLSMSPNPSLDDYLRSIKIIADSLAFVNCPVSDIDLIYSTINGLSSDYDYVLGNIVGSATRMTFNQFRSSLLSLEPVVRHKVTRDVGDHTPTTTSFLAHHNNMSNSTSTSHASHGSHNHAATPTNTNNSYRGGHNNNKGRGKYNNGNRSRQGNQMSSSTPSQSSQDMPTCNALVSRPVQCMVFNVLIILLYLISLQVTILPQVYLDLPRGRICWYPGHSALQCSKFPKTTPNFCCSLSSCFVC